MCDSITYLPPGAVIWESMPHAPWPAPVPQPHASAAGRAALYIMLTVEITSRAAVVHRALSELTAAQ